MVALVIVILVNVLVNLGLLVHNVLQVTGFYDVFAIIILVFVYLVLSYSLNTVILAPVEITSFYEMTGVATATLLYRASRDGYHANAFHARCDGKSRTVTIIKTKTNYIFGGYTSQPWASSGGYLGDSSAYLFRFRSNGVSGYSGRYGMYSSSTRVTYYAIHRSSYGPTFGGYYYYYSSTNYGYNYDHDIIVPVQSDIYAGTCTLNSFSVSSTTLAGSTSWSISDIEVFQI